MSINSRTLEWLQGLQRDLDLFEGSKIAELGPQDLSRVGGVHSPRARFEGWTGRDLYLHLGCAEYHSFDLIDSRSVRVDFNCPPTGTSDFTVVTNFGTSEHVFNQAAVMGFIHELTADSGVMLHVLPSAGGRDHGFFNYHPGFFYDLAAANNYEILSFEYLPHYGIQASLPIDPIAVDLTFRKSTRSVGEALVKRAVLKLFLDRRVVFLNLRLLFRSIRRLNFGPFFEVFGGGDYIHIALRKTENRPFRMPLQGVYRAQE